MSTDKRNTVKIDLDELIKLNDYTDIGNTTIESIGDSTYICGNILLGPNMGSLSRKEVINILITTIEWAKVAIKDLRTTQKAQPEDYL